MEREDALVLAMDLDPVFAQRPPATAVYAALRLVTPTLFFLSSASTSFSFLRPRPAHADRRFP